MLESHGNIWDFHVQGYWITIPINWSTKQNGNAIMGAGLARQAAEKYPDIPKWLGEIIQIDTLHVVHQSLKKILFFPTKKHWKENSTIDLITQGCFDMNFIQQNFIPKSNVPIYLPMLGCGLGHLQWNDVLPILHAKLDDNFCVLI